MVINFQGGCLSPIAMDNMQRGLATLDCSVDAGV